MRHLKIHEHGRHTPGANQAAAGGTNNNWHLVDATADCKRPHSGPGAWWYGREGVMAHIRGLHDPHSLQNVLSLQPAASRNLSSRWRYVTVLLQSHPSLSLHQTSYIRRSVLKKKFIFSFFINIKNRFFLFFFSFLFVLFVFNFFIYFLVFHQTDCVFWLHIITVYKPEHINLSMSIY